MSLNLIAPMCCRNHAIRRVLDDFLIQIKIRKRRAEMFSQRELLPCFIRKNQFLYAIFKTKFSRKSPELKDKLTEIKQIPCKLVANYFRTILRDMKN